MSDFFGKLKSGAGKVAFEADKMGRLNKAQGELGQLKRQIETHYTKLGEMYYHHYVSQDEDASGYNEICAQIAEFERQVGVKTEDVARINAETYNPPGSVPAPPPPQPHIATAPLPPMPVEETPEPPAAAATKFCSNCGKEMAVAVKFCPDCGTKV